MGKQVGQQGGAGERGQAAQVDKAGGSLEALGPAASATPGEETVLTHCRGRGGPQAMGSNLEGGQQSAA